MKRLIIAYFCAFFLSPICSLAAPFSEKEIFNVLQKESDKIFDSQRADLHINNALIKDALFLFLGVPKTPKNTATGYMFMDGCRVQSCVEKGAVIVDTKEKHLQAASLLHFNCRLVVLTQDELKTVSKLRNPPLRSECDKEATLEVFLIRRSATLAKLADEGRLLEEMRLWGKTVGYVREHVRILEVR